MDGQYDFNKKIVEYVSEGLKDVKYNKLRIIPTSRKEEVMTNIYEYMKQRCADKIRIDKEDDECEFHLLFKTKNEMLIYNIFVENLVMYVNSKLDKGLQRVYSVCNSGNTIYSNYTIRIDYNC